MQTNPLPLYWQYSWCDPIFGDLRGCMWMLLWLIAGWTTFQSCRDLCLARHWQKQALYLLTEPDNYCWISKCENQRNDTKCSQYGTLPSQSCQDWLMVGSKGVGWAIWVILPTWAESFCWHWGHLAVNEVGGDARQRGIGQVPAQKTCQIG